ncbi:MAG TPA: hypothetical protein VGW78_05785 [Candidatus Babeliales bacterium]|jgi:hypothetical protein|nr:hypothetical protein [Candidatus Babeliales bacterium]
MKKFKQPQMLLIAITLWISTLTHAIIPSMHGGDASVIPYFGLKCQPLEFCIPPQTMRLGTSMIIFTSGFLFTCYCLCKKGYIEAGTTALTTAGALSLLKWEII